MSLTKPKWILDDRWAIGIDSYNWALLYRASNNKAWVTKGYYATPEKLFAGLYRKLARMKPQDKDLLRHLERTCEAVEALYQRLSDQLNAEVWSGLTRPTAHSSKAEQKVS
jgi:predicted component of type VI protein secretion system